MSDANGPQIPLSDDLSSGGDPIVGGPEDATPPPRRPPEQPPRPFPVSVAGAVLGAALGAFVWFLIEFYLEYQVGYVAILVGALAGGGAVLLGRRKSVAVGAIAALAGVVGVFAGSYATYFAALRSDEVVGQWRSDFDSAVAAMDAMDPAEREETLAAAPADVQEIMGGLYRDGSEPTAEAREAAFDRFCDAIRADESVSYAAFVTQDSKYLMYLGLFGLIGLFIAFKVGSGRTSS